MSQVRIDICYKAPRKDDKPELSADSLQSFYLLSAGRSKFEEGFYHIDVTTL
ncbi:hypothetical protein S7335_874 [Synechococcus sp. PCC 7335]|nr:hypothetical protein S7335_874 [Synechococcus sp. PCC 7335]